MTDSNNPQTAKVIGDYAQFPAVDVSPSLRVEDVPMDYLEDIKAFYQTLSLLWKDFYAGLSNDDESVRTTTLEKVNGLLTDRLFEHVYIDGTFNVFNCIPFDEAKGKIEFYISPKSIRENIPYMELMYNYRVQLENLSWYKYAPYNIKDNLYDKLEYDGFTVNYTDLLQHTTYGLNENKEPIFNIECIVSSKIADKVLEQKNVTFKKDGKDIGKRQVWIPTKCNALPLFLRNAIGEYGLLHYTGYVEFVPESEKDSTVQYQPLVGLKDSVLMISKMRFVPECFVCQRCNWQSPLSKCSICKKTLYCSKDCQRKNYVKHKRTCKK